MKKLFIRYLSRRNEKCAKLTQEYFPFPNYIEQYKNICYEYLLDGSTVLHLGSGSDSCRICSSNYRVNWISLDIDIDSLKRNPNGGPKINADAARIPLKENSIDLVISEHTFEHFRNPLRVLGEVYRCLKGGGRLVFTTPNKYSYVGFLARWTPLWFHRYYKSVLLLNNNSSELDTTCFRFNDLRTIQEVGRKVGFQRLTIKMVEREPSYFCFSPTLFRIMSFYHRLLVKSNTLSGIRTSIIGIFEK